LAELIKAVELDPQFADAHLAIGHTLHKLKRLPEAVDAIKKAIAINAQEVLYHTSLSTVYRDLGMIPEAEDEMAVSSQLQRGY
jgi:Tfp pilus assembly protein PilF